MNIKRTMLVLACIITLALCSTVSAADTTNITSNSSNSSVHSLQSSTSVNNTSSQPPDPIISGVIKDNSTNKGLGNVTIKVLQNNTQVAQTTTNNDGKYSLNFTNSNTNFIIIASKLGYMPISRSITVVPSSNLSDPNLYGTADFKLYKLLKYSGNASSYVLNVGALPQILLDIYAGKSSAWVNSSSTNYSKGGGTSLEIKLLSFSLLSGLLDVYSTANDGYKAGGLLPSTNSTLKNILNNLGLDVSLLSAYSNSSADMPSASGTGTLASLNLDIKLLDLIKILGLNVGAVGSSSSVIPNFNTGVLVSTSSAGVANVTITLLGDKLLEIEALQTVATASVNGKPGGASATFNWQVASIKLRGVNITLDQLKAGISIPGILTLSLGSLETTTSPDGTYAKASGDALRLQVLEILGGGLVNLIIGHVEAEAQVPVGGLHVNTSDLEVSKTVNNTHPNYLQNITYTLKVHNNGPDTATGITVTDKLPSGLKFLSTSGNGTYNPTTGIWTIDTLTNGTNAVLQIVAQVIASNTSITNIAGVNGSNYDPNPGNDQSNTTITVDPASDLIINKIVDNSHPKYLQNVTYTLTAHNNGPDNAAGTIVLDKLPAGLKFISASGNGTYDSTTGIWTIGTLANGENAILQIVAQIITSNTQITNIAGINGTNYDQNTSNNESNTTVTVDPASDLGITKTVNNSHPNYLQNVTFTIKVHNYGPDTATGVIVLDKLPSGLKFISSNGNYDAATGTWTIGTLANGQEAILNIIAQVITSNTQITNIAGVNGTNYDQNSTNNESNTTINVSSASDLGITKTVDKKTANYLDKIYYTITVTNHGPDQANNIIVNDYLPTGLQWISDNSSGAYNHATGVWVIDTLANGGSITLNILAQIIKSNTVITNVATVNNNTYDQNSTNNQDQTTTTVSSASDLNISKTVNNTHPKYHENVTFTITAHNNGPDTATGVIILDKLPAGLTWVSDDSEGIYNPTTGIWTIGTLANGESAVLKIIARITTSNTQITNIASINGTNYDQNSTNSESNSTVTVDPASDLGITKTVNNTHPNYLQNVTFTINVHNYGPDDATGVIVTDKLPTGLKFISSNGNYDPATGTWTIDTLGNGQEAVLNIISQVIASNTQITNIAGVNGTNYDQNSSNNQSNATIIVNAASDLTIIKTVNNKHPKYLQNVTYTLKVYNNGPDAATGVTAIDKLPTGLKFISTDGNYDATTGIWTIGTLANGQEAVLNIIAQVITSNTQITNIAEVNGTDYDQNSTNNQSNTTIHVDLASDLGITKIVNNSKPNYLQNVTFTLTAHNYGPDNATGVKVTDILPNGLKLISVSGDGIYDSTTGIWTIGNLANGATAVLNIIAQAVSANTQVINTASITGTNYDQNSTNDQSSATVNIKPASDLGIKITVDNAHPAYKDYVTFTLTATNAGPNDAVYVKVYNTLPDKLKYISDDSNGIFNSTTGLWTIGYLATGETAVLHIVAQAMTSNVILTDVARITDPDPVGTTDFYDPNQDNDQSSVTVGVDPVIDLSITKTVNNSKPNYLQNIIFTLTAHNKGPDTATGITVTDKLPSGLKFLSVNGNGAYDSTRGIWTIGSLANGGNAVLNIIVQVITANTQIINTASITG